VKKRTDVFVSGQSKQNVWTQQEKENNQDSFILYTNKGNLRFPFEPSLFLLCIFFLFLLCLFFLFLLCLFFLLLLKQHFALITYLFTVSSSHPPFPQLKTTTEQWVCEENAKQPRKQGREPTQQPF
jgi:hypothetical protein